MKRSKFLPCGAIVVFSLLSCASLLLLVGTLHAFGDDRKPSVSMRDKYVRIDVYLDEKEAKVGNPVVVKIVVTNLTDKHLAVTKRHGESQRILQSVQEIGEKEFPVCCFLIYPDIIRTEPLPEDRRFSVGPGMAGVYGYLPVYFSDLFLFKPRETKKYKFAVVPKIPGEATLRVVASSSISTDKYDEAFRKKGLPEGVHIWKGKFETLLSKNRIKVATENPHIIERRASRLISKLMNRKQSFWERSKLIQKEIERRISSEALVLSRVLKKLPKASPLQFVVVSEMVKMVREGYGHMLTEQLLCIAQNPLESTGTRLYALDVAFSVVKQEYLSVNLDYNLATIEISAALKKKAKAVLKACAGSEDKAISARAKYLLGALSENEKKRKGEKNHGKLEKESKTAPEEGNGEDSSTAEPAVKEKPKPIKKPKLEIEPVRAEDELGRDWLVICLVVVIIVQAGAIIFLLLRRKK